MTAERHRILQLVKEGKISTTDALTLLEALDKENVEVNQSVIVPTFEQKPKKEKVDESFTASFSQAKDKVFDFVQTAFTKVKDIEKQFTQPVTFSRVFEEPNVEEVNSLDLDISNGKVEVIPWDQSDVRIECQVKVYRKDNEEEAKVYFEDKTLFSLDQSVLKFKTESKWMRVHTKVYVPRRSSTSPFNNIHIKTFNGNITTNGLYVTDFQAKTGNGKILLRHLYADQSSIETGNGQILIEGSVLQKVEAETLNGHLEVKGAFYYADFSTFNGNIDVQLDGSGSESIYAKAITGNISARLVTNCPIIGEAKSNFGKVKIDIPDVTKIEEKSETLQKSVKFHKNEDSADVIRFIADTKTGTVHFLEQKD